MTAMKYSGTYNGKESTDEAERAHDCDERVHFCVFRLSEQWVSALDAAAIDPAVPAVLVLSLHQGELTGTGEV